LILNGTHLLLVYVDEVIVFVRSIHNIKKSTEDLVVRRLE